MFWKYWLFAVLKATPRPGKPKIGGTRFPTLNQTFPAQCDVSTYLFLGWVRLEIGDSVYKLDRQAEQVEDTTLQACRCREDSELVVVCRCVVAA